jgi:hypothetical protein
VITVMLLIPKYEEGIHYLCGNSIKQQYMKSVSEEREKQSFVLILKMKMNVHKEWEGCEINQLQ